MALLWVFLGVPTAFWNRRTCAFACRALTTCRRRAYRISYSIFAMLTLLVPMLFNLCPGRLPLLAVDWALGSRCSSDWWPRPWDSPYGPSGSWCWPGWIFSALSRP
ncbi:hypothetical protein DFAR_1180001 [Desulfarculales bacterium]